MERFGSFFRFVISISLFRQHMDDAGTVIRLGLTERVLHSGQVMSVDRPEISESQRFKKAMQTITYAPHFVSTIVVVGMMTAMTSPSTGVINKLLVSLRLVDEPIYFMGSSKYFRFMYIYSALWKDGGWNAIIFISALAAIDPSLYEAATVDGASRMQQLIHVTLPSILPTIVIMLILESGKVLNVGYEKAYAMQNDLNLAVSEVISTYSYKRGLEAMEYDYATAIGLFNSVISFTMLITVNAIAKRASETSLF